MTGIRADANEEIATGHMMRCITIAGQLKKLGEDVVFFLADEYAVPMLEQAGMEYVCLNTSWKLMEEETPLLLEEMKKRKCRRLLVDSYQATKKYFEGLGNFCRLIYIDDMFEEIYPVDMVVNYNAYHTLFPYQESYGEKARLLLGTEYVPLRQEFSEGAGGAETEEPHFLLSCGGGDVHHALLGILSEAIRRKELQTVIFHTVVGRFYTDNGELEELAAGNEKIRLHYDVKNMSELMKKCQCAVSAAGTVLFELCAMQVPTVFFVCADNQNYDSEFFDREERMLFAGDIRNDRAGCIRRIVDGLERLSGDARLRERMKEKLGQITDGNGAARIAEEILKL